MPRKSAPGDEESTSSPTAKVLAENLAALMKAHPELDSNPKLAKKLDMSTATFSRLRNAQVEATVKTLDKLAQAFDVAAWELLVPALDPANRPALQAVSTKERELYERLREVAKEIKES